MQNFFEIVRIVIEIQGEEVVHPLEMSKFEASELSNYFL